MSEPPHRVEAGRRREAVSEMVCQRLKMAHDVECLGLNGLAREPAAEIRDGLKEIDVGPAAQISWRRARLAMLQAKPRERLQGAHHMTRIVLGQSGDRIIRARRSIQPAPEPLFEDGVERGLA